MRQARHTRRRRVTQAPSAPSGSVGRLMAGLVVAATIVPWTPAPAATLDAPADVAPVVALADVESMPVPAAVHVPLILKILTYDRYFNKRGWAAYRIGIVYAGNDPASSKVGNDIAEVFRSWTVRNLPIESTTVEYMSDSQVEGVVKSGQFAMLYIAPGNARNLQRLLQVCQGEHIITTTAVPAYVEQGVAVGIGVRQDKPEILINLRSSKSAGSEFDASLLRIARVIR